ncbi:MAG: tetratricopeptide repeat protein [Cyanobacteria bacterium P01_G01_bin.19]
MIRVDEAHIALEQAKIHWQAEQWQLTVEACAKALALKQNLAEAHKLMGNALEKIKKPKEAIGYYQQAIAIQPNLALVHYRLGSLYTDRQQWQKAIKHYRQALQIAPKLRNGRQQLERVLKLQQQQPEAVLKPGVPTLTLEDRLRHGKMLEQQGKLEAALEQYRLAAELTPHKISIYRKIVSISERLGLWQNAAHYCRSLLQFSGSSGVSQPKCISPSREQNFSQQSESQRLNANDYLELARNSIGNKKYRDAIAYYHRAIEKQPSLAEAYLEWGELLSQSGVTEQAIGCYLQGLKHIRHNPELYYRLGSLYQLRSKWSQAAVCLQKATQQAPNHARAYHKLGEVLSSLEQWSDAIASYRQALKCNPDCATSYINLGYALIRLNCWQEAIPAYQKAIELDPDYPWSYYNLAEAYSMLHQWSEAADLYQKAAQIRADLPQLQQKLGNALYQRGHQDLERALQHFMEAIDREPGDLTAYHQAIAIDNTNLDLYLKLGDRLIQQGQLNEGIITYQMALKIDSHSSKAIARLQKALQNRD